MINTTLGGRPDLTDQSMSASSGDCLHHAILFSRLGTVFAANQGLTRQHIVSALGEERYDREEFQFV